MRTRKVELMPGEMVGFIHFLTTLISTECPLCLSHLFDFHRCLGRARPTICREREKESITILLMLHNERDR